MERSFTQLRDLIVSHLVPGVETSHESDVRMRDLAEALG